MNMFFSVLLQMDDWIKEGKPMPIDDVNHGKARDLLNKVLGVSPRDVTLRLNEDEMQHCRAMLGPSGYAYYRALLIRCGGFDMEHDWRENR